MSYYPCAMDSLHGDEDEIAAILFEEEIARQEFLASFEDNDEEVEE